MAKGMERREALGVLAGTAATGLIGCDDGGTPDTERIGELSQALCPSTTTAEELLAPLLLPGTYAYGEKTARAGDTLHFHISSDTPYRLSVVRLGWETGPPPGVNPNEWSPTRDTVIATFPDRPASVQP